VSVVSDAGPLIALAKANLLPILSALFQEVWIPPEVYREMLAKSSPECDWLRQALGGLIQVAPHSPLPPEVVTATIGLDEGERHAIAFALHSGLLLVMDDLQARHACRRFGLRVTGTVGVLLRAKQEGLLVCVRPVLDLMQGQGYWFSKSLIEQATELAGE
jgi:predicted nucleic acid-binding protein